MKIRNLSAVGLAACLAALGCGNGSTNAEPSGQVKVGLKTHAIVPPSSSLTSYDLCGDFTLTPYPLDAGGNQGPQAGPALTLTNVGTGGVSAITGCFDTLASPANDWRYWVSGTNFHFCDGSPLPAGWSISPLTTTSQIDIDCTAGKDVNASVNVNVSISMPGNVGFVDVAVNIEETFITQNCKQLDIPNLADPTVQHAGIAEVGYNADGQIFAPRSTLTLLDSTKADIFAQYVGSITDSGGLTAYYNTKRIKSDVGYEMIQANVQRCPVGQNFLETGIPWCKSKLDVNAETGVAVATTTAGLANAALIGRLQVNTQESALYGVGFANVADANTLKLQYVAKEANYSDPSGTPAIAEKAMYNAGFATQYITDQSGDINFRGIYPTNDGRFSTLFDIGGDQYMALLGYDVKAGAFTDAKAFLLSGASAGTFDCLGGTAVSNCKEWAQCQSFVNSEVKRTEAVQARKGSYVHTGPVNPQPTARWSCDYNGNGQACSCTYIRPDGSTGGTYSGTGTSTFFGLIKQCDISASL